MTVISTIALKGGVGKTTLTHMTAGALVLAGHRVLILDNDPQSSISSGFFGPTAVESLDPTTTIAALYTGQDPLPAQIIHRSGIPGIDLVPGSKAAGRFNLPEPHLTSASLQTCLRTFLDEVRPSYDTILIDNPPNLCLATWAALMASDHAVVAVVPEDYGSASLSPVFESVALVRSGPNPHLNLLGLVLTMVQPRLAVHQIYEQTLRDLHGSGIFDTRIALAADIKESISQRRPITHYKPRGASAKAFKSLAEEITARISTAATSHATRNREVA